MYFCDNNMTFREGSAQLRGHQWSQYLQLLVSLPERIANRLHKKEDIPILFKPSYEQIRHLDPLF